MSCKACKEVDTSDKKFSLVGVMEITILGHTPTCAFLDAGGFITKNHECATMRMLRTLCDDSFYRQAPGHIARSDDQTCATLPWGGKFILLGWYKSRGRVETAVIMDEDSVRSLTLADAEDCLEHYRKMEPAQR